jgi:hypothetical protein
LWGCLYDAFDRAAGKFLEGALPYSNDCPAFALKQFVGAVVIVSVAKDLLLPVVGVIFRCSVNGWSSVPEIAVNENG